MQGDSLLWMDGMDVPEEGSYTIQLAQVEADDYIVFSDGWDEFKTHSNIVLGSLLLVKVEARVDAIGLDFVEII